MIEGGRAGRLVVLLFILFFFLSLFFLLRASVLPPRLLDVGALCGVLAGLVSVIADRGFVLPSPLLPAASCTRAPPCSTIQGRPDPPAGHIIAVEICDVATTLAKKEACVFEPKHDAQIGAQA